MTTMIATTIRRRIVYNRANIEYFPLPATGNLSAVLAEALSMLSFGGSLVDDVVEYGRCPLQFLRPRFWET